jgi:hypothetical protein
MKLSFDAVVGFVSLAMSPTLAAFSFEKSVAGKACEQAEPRSPTMLNTETEASLTVNFGFFRKKCGSDGRGYSAKPMDDALGNKIESVRQVRQTARPLRVLASCAIIIKAEAPTRRVRHRAILTRYSGTRSEARHVLPA